MPNVFFISDLHLGHKNILEFTGEYRGGDTVEEHDEWIVERWNSVVRSRDLVHVLGDVAFTHSGLDLCQFMNGKKKLVMGNHDVFPLEEYLQHFTILPGIAKYKEFWLSHAPIHSCELRGKKNIHGHMHDRRVKLKHNPSQNDPNYINVCVEGLKGIPISLDSIRDSLME